MGRLFWKFFFFIWLAQLAAMFGIGGMIWLKDQARNAQVVAAMPPFESLAPAGTPDIRPEPGPNGRPRPPAQRVSMPDGQHFLLIPAPGNGFRPDRPPPGEPHFLPLIPFITALFASLIFAAVLAWYFSRPIRILRDAFDSLASGNLSLRIAPEMGRRRDELADLGHDFDHMADQLQTLITGQRRLLHDVSHEMRSPLARLQAVIGIARQQPERLAASMDRIELECERMDKLVGELLALSRLEAGVDSRQEETFSARQLLEELLEDARFEATPLQREVHLLDGADAQIHGHPELLHRALENVVRNAIRHTPAGSSVELETIVQDGSLLIAIQDQGPGVRAEELQTIFEPFYRGTDQTGGDGHGLGLAIARRVMEMHGGTISASNRAAGGLRVEITLPVRTPDQPAG